MEASNLKEHLTLANKSLISSLTTLANYFSGGYYEPRNDDEAKLAGVIQNAIADHKAQPVVQYELVGYIFKGDQWDERHFVFKIPEGANETMFSAVYEKKWSNLIGVKDDCSQIKRASISSNS